MLQHRVLEATQCANPGAILGRGKRLGASAAAVIWHGAAQLAMLTARRFDRELRHPKGAGQLT
jgi:hypothetical protein